MTSVINRNNCGQQRTREPAIAIILTLMEVGETVVSKRQWVTHLPANFQTHGALYLLRNRSDWIGTLLSCHWREWGVDLSAGEKSRLEDYFKSYLYISCIGYLFYRYISKSAFRCIHQTSLNDNYRRYTRANAHTMYIIYIIRHIVSVLVYHVVHLHELRPSVA